MTNTSSSPSAKILKLLYSSRPISWINTAYPFAAAYLATGGAVDALFLWSCFFFLIPYNVLIYVVNDVYDYASDSKNPRKNSIEGGLLAPELHRFMLLATACITSVSALPIILLTEPIELFTFTALVVGAVVYSAPPFRTKERAFLDSLTSSFHFVGPMLFAFILTGWRPEYTGYIFAFTLWGCASHMFGAVQDIKSDRQAGIRSIATALGATKTVRLSIVLYGLAALMVSTYGFPQTIVGAGLLLYILVTYPYRNIPDSKSSQTNHGWRQFLLINQIIGALITILIVWEFTHG
jgi:4-hydroxybenzoate polyprenyltransferase